MSCTVSSVRGGTTSRKNIIAKTVTTNNPTVLKNITLNDLYDYIKDGFTWILFMGVYGSSISTATNKGTTPHSVTIKELIFMIENCYLHANNDNALLFYAETYGEYGRFEIHYRTDKSIDIVAEMGRLTNYTYYVDLW